MSNKKEQIDATVLDLYNKVKAKKAEIQLAAAKPSWKTSCTFGKGDGVAGNVNIQTIKDTDVLIDLYAFLLGREANYNQAANELGLKAGKNLFQGFPFEDWKADFKTRVGAIQLAEKKQDLSTLEAKLDRLLSPDQKRELELAEIQKELQ